MTQREIQLCIISDVHLGTYGCHASELVQYLKSVKPEILVLNGDIIDGWAFSKRYFPPAHLQVIKEIMTLLSNGTRVYYITGNHDEMLRRYSGFVMGDLILDDKVILDIDGQKAWIFHGDVFDASTKGAARWLAKLGGKGYDILILINRFINFILMLLGREKMSVSKRVKAGIKKAVKWIGDFEQCAAEMAADRGYSFVICGHIHQPQDRIIEVGNKKVRYLNSGDWVENLTALEFSDGAWTLYQHESARQSHQLIHVITKRHPAPDVLNNAFEFVIGGSSK